MIDELVTLEEVERRAANADTAATDRKAKSNVGGMQVLANKFEWITDANTAVILTGNWLVKHVLPKAGLGVMFGPPGCGKTFAALDLALHIAAGEDWREYRVKPAAVSYIAMEAGRLAQNRVHAWIGHHKKLWPKRFRMSPKTLDLRSSDKDVRALIQDIRDNQPNVGLVVVDTLSRALVGGNENGPEDMGLLVARCEHMAFELECFVLLVHHTGKDEAKGSRGHTCLTGAINTELEVRRQQGEPGTITVTKQRDGEVGFRFGFDLAVEQLGVDEDEERVSSCVVVPIDAGEFKRATQAKPSGFNEVAVARAFDQFVLDRGQPNPAGTGFPDPGKVHTVDFEDFRTFATGKFEGETTKAKSRKARDAIKSLINRGLFAVNEGRLWRVR
jgi:AAA domain